MASLLGFYWNTLFFQNILRYNRENIRKLGKCGSISGGFYCNTVCLKRKNFQKKNLKIEQGLASTSEIYRFPKNIFPWEEVKNGSLALLNIATAKEEYKLVKKPVSLKIKGLENLANDEDEFMVRDKVAEELIDKILRNAL